YGATEAPAVAGQFYNRNEAPSATTICTPQPFLTLRITLADGREAQTGEGGEIWIGGCAVADGYWNKPELTAEKFVELEGRRWYRTGDKGRRLEDGRIEILGRIDLSEVKINGVRINLPEICEALRALNAVRDAWVSAVEPGAGRDPLLVGHCVTENAGDFDAALFRNKLVARLPAAAVPRFLMRHERFPLTANGKLDAQSLARDAAAFIKSPPLHSSNDENVAARPVYLQELEAHLVDVWRDILENPDIDLDSDFFAHGGTSLLAVRLNSAIEKAFGVRPQLTAVFEAPTVRQLALRMKSEAGEGGAVLLAQTDLDDTAPALFALHGLFVYRDLANGLKDTAHTYGVFLEEEAQSQNSQTHDDVKDAEQLAARYAEQILRIRPQGPYHLAGLSRGGLIALDTAKLLREMGHEVGLVGLLDTNAPQTLWRARISNTKKMLRTLAGRGDKKFSGEDITDALYRDAHRRLAASPYQGDVAVLRAEISDFGARRDDLGWSGYIDGNVSVAEIPGDHLGILKPPNVEKLAAHLSAYIAKLSAQ
ncbi:MAG: AMP-binding protein, partial [Marinicaulis sp.]|nr:AMP-binding protein [Marinicaulis sp.]